MNSSGSVHLDSLTTLGDEQWDAAVAATGLPFRFSHRAAAGRAFEAAYPSYRFSPLRADYSDGARILYPLIRVDRRLDAMSWVVGMPFGLEGTPLPLSGSVTAEHVLALFRALRPCGTLKLEGGAGLSPPVAGSVNRSITHTLELGAGFDALWTRSFTPTNRNKCRKAQRGGVVVEVTSSAEAIESYWALYAAAATAWGQGEPPYPRALFTAFLASDAAELWVARAGSELIAGALLLAGSDDLLYWGAALDREYRHLAPANAVLAAAIESACARGVRYLDFGPSRDLPGVESFKRSFGAEPCEYLSTELSTFRQRQLTRMQRRLASISIGPAAAASAR